jgi:hypothetical protein
MQILKRTYAAVAIGVVIFGCSVKTQPLPSAVYRADDGSQSIVVQGKRIRFIVRLDANQANLFDRTYDNHSIWDNGRIQPFPMRDVDAVLGIGKFDWFWDGTNITRTNRITGEAITFFGPAPN